MNKALKDIMNEKIEDAWAEMYNELENKTNLKYNGDISPLDYLKLSEYTDKIVELFLKVSAQNVEE